MDFQTNILTTLVEEARRGIRRKRYFLREKEYRAFCAQLRQYVTVDHEDGTWCSYPDWLMGPDPPYLGIYGPLGPVEVWPLRVIK